MATGRLLAIWVAMLLLLLASAAATFLPIGLWRQAISLAIAAVKAGLILWFFMDFRRSDGLVRLAGLATLCFLSIMLILFSADFLTRD